MRLYLRVFGAHCAVAAAYPFYKATMGELKDDQVALVPGKVVITGMIWPISWAGISVAFVVKAWNLAMNLPDFPPVQQWFEDTETYDRETSN